MFKQSLLITKIFHHHHKSAVTSYLNKIVELKFMNSSVYQQFYILNLQNSLSMHQEWDQTSKFKSTFLYVDCTMLINKVLLKFVAMFLMFVVPIWSSIPSESFIKWKTLTNSQNWHENSNLLKLIHTISKKVYRIVTKKRIPYFFIE